MQSRQLRKALRRLWRKNGLSFDGSRPGLSVAEIQRHSDRRNRTKKLNQFELWNEIYDEYVSWMLSLTIVVYSRLKRHYRSKGPRYEFFRAQSVLLFRILADLLSIRILCRSGFDVAGKTLARSTIEYIDTLVFLNLHPGVAREFNRSTKNEISNAFWHKYIAREKIRRALLPVWNKTFGEGFDAEGWDEWLYQYHNVLGMSVHPSFSGGLFSALALGSGSTDQWLGAFGDRADISKDTFYHLIIHIWKLTLIFPDFPFRNDASNKLAVRYDNRSEFHRHVKIGGRVLMALLVTIWNPKIRRHFFRRVDTSNIWPQKSRAGAHKRGAPRAR